MSFPIQCERTYVNPGGNLSASGYYRSFIDQRLANMFPQWMHIRSNPRSKGQQFMSPMAIFLDELEGKMDDVFKSKFLSTAPVNEIDVLYKLKIPSSIDLTNASASGIRCVTAPSGCSPSGVDNIWVEEIDDLESFYYHQLPTRLEITASGGYAGQIDNTLWKPSPTGVLDLDQKYIDFWKVEHDITWAYDNGFRKQDRESMGNYDIYEMNGSGTLVDMCFYDNMLWWVGKESNNYFINISNPKTQQPKQVNLDILAVFDISTIYDSYGHEPSGIIIDEERTIHILDRNKSRVYQLKPRYDYFIADKDNRQIYFREDYKNSGVFVSNI